MRKPRKPPAEPPEPRPGVHISTAKLTDEPGVKRMIVNTAKARMKPGAVVHWLQSSAMNGRGEVETTLTAVMEWTE